MPNAAKVELHLEGVKDPSPMTKASDGTWSVSVPGLAPQYYSYSFEVDGTHVLDPHNVTLKPSFFNVDNVFLVPGHPPMPWESADVPHGVLHHHYYHSNIVGINSEYYVYTPPGFDPASKQKYPVLYLLHGYSDDPSAWTGMGKANVILDNLMAQGKVKPMIVVMPLGYGTMEVITRGWTAWRDPELVRRNYTRFSDALFEEVMPLVKQQYPLSDKREDHAVAGLSMGGAESLRVGLNHIDDFAYVGGFSSAPVGASRLRFSLPWYHRAVGARHQCPAATALDFLRNRGRPVRWQSEVYRLAEGERPATDRHSDPGHACVDGVARQSVALRASAVSVEVRIKVAPASRRLSGGRPARPSGRPEAGAIKNSSQSSPALPHERGARAYIVIFYSAATAEGWPPVAGTGPPTRPSVPTVESKL